MARQLWLLRHGDAEPHGTRPDAERRLTDKGEQQAADAGVAIARLGVEPVVVFTSPKVRAHATATGAARALDIDVILHAPLAEGFDAAEARTLLTSAEDGERIVVVGHEPDFSQVTFDLTGANVDFKKGGIAVIRLQEPSGRGELIALLRPAELSAIAHP